MSKPVLDSIFNKELFSARRNRKSFAQFIGLQFGLNILGIILMITVGNAIGSAAGIFVLALWALFGVLQFITFCVVGQRIRDVGYSGTWAIAIALGLGVPFVNFFAAVAFIILFFLPGETEVDNKYGPSLIKA